MATTKKNWQELCEEMPERITLTQECDAPVRVIGRADIGGSVYRCVDMLGEELFIGIPEFRAEEAAEWDSNEYHLWKREGKYFTWEKGYIKK